MNENLQKSIDTALQTVLDGLQAGVDFTKTQVPLLLQEKLAYDFYYYLFFSLFWLLLAVLAAVWAYKWAQAANADKFNRAEFHCAGYIPAGIVWFLALIALGNNIPNMIQIHVAPRLYLMEWLVSLVNSK